MSNIDDLAKQFEAHGYKVQRVVRPTIVVNGKKTDIERGSIRHAEIDATHRMKEDGSYFK